MAKTTCWDTSCFTVAGEYGTCFSWRSTVFSMFSGFMASTLPRRSYTPWRSARSSGSFSGVTRTARLARLFTITRPSRSTISPRGACTLISRT